MVLNVFVSVVMLLLMSMLYLFFLSVDFMCFLRVMLNSVLFLRKLVVVVNLCLCLIM